MLVDIDKIIVGERIRRDFGDIQELADDIKQNTLLNALVVTPNGEGTYLLIAGERRLRACKMLGYKAVTVNSVGVEDAERALRMEISENECRKEFTMTERLAYAEKLQAIKAAEANARMLAGKANPTPNSAEGQKGETRDAVASAIGMGHETLRQARIIAGNADLLDPADFESWDEGRLSTNQAFQKIKEAQRKAEQERDEALDELEEAYHSAELMEAEVASLRRQVAEKPQPEVVEREVVPSDYEKIKRENERLTREYQELWRKKRNVEQKLDEANELLGEKDRDGNAQRDIEHLTIATNTYLRNYGGKAWAFDQFYRVDETTQDEFRKAITNLASFAQNLVQLIQDRNMIGE